MKRNTVNLLFTMLLFLVFVVSALFTVLIGGKVYENINVRSQDNYTASVSLQYVANKIRQGDQKGSISVIQVENTPVLQICSEVGENSYASWIYYYDGGIRELFADPADGLGLADGLEILTCEGFFVEALSQGRQIRISTAGKGGGELVLTLRSAGQNGYAGPAQPAAGGRTDG